MDKDQWETPQWFFDELDKEFDFDWDACCGVVYDNRFPCEGGGGSYCNSKVQRPFEDYDYLKFDIVEYNKTERQLALDYGFSTDDCRTITTVFMNPPYSDIGPFLEKAIKDSQFYKIVCLLPVDTSTKWWALIWDRENYKPRSGVEVRFYPYKSHHKSRLKFEYDGVPAKNGYTRPVCVVVLDKVD